MDWFTDIIDLIITGKIETPEQLHRVKVELCKKHGLDRVPKNSEILARIPEEYYERAEKLLRIKRIRSLSGVAVIAAMTSPYECPHGKCYYCPGGVEHNTPQSYVGYEPAALRARHNDYDPYKQVSSRLEQLQAIGHVTDKVDLIIMGGTFTSRPEDYREWFAQQCFDALNGKTSDSLEQAHRINETANARCIGLTVETRPDHFLEPEIKHSMGLGATRVELGVQTVYDDILEFVERGHKIKESIQATKLAKDAGLKVCYHMMPALPHSDFEKDLEAFRTIFTDSGFKPDMLKIYPTLVVKGTKLYDMWKSGDYEPYNDEQLMKLVMEVKKMIPPWVRIQRIQRDIPKQFIEAGPKKSHLRQMVQERMKNEGLKCNCIRCREVGLKGLDGKGLDSRNIKQKRIEYEASGSTEVFLSYEDVSNDSIVGYARLRKRDDCGILRELKVFGQVVPISLEPKGKWQHRGYGSNLLSECERIVRDEWNDSKLLVNSGVGAREYYRKFGYERHGYYMAKDFI
jgi:elongator complex protein 3